MMIPLFLAVCMAQFDPADAELSKLCQVKVQTARNGKAERQLVHIRDWHFVSRDAWKTDLQDQDATLTDEQIEKSYQRFLVQVDGVQREQFKVLRHLVRRHEVEDVFLEGFTEQDEILIAALLRNLRSKTPNIDFVRALGAAGKLAAKQKLKLLPAEQSAAYFAANPIADGNFKIDQDAMRKRDAAIVRRLEHEEFAVVVLGANHDLTKEVSDTTELITLTVPALAKIIEDGN